jgi:hypothetical protein
LMVAVMLMSVAAAAFNDRLSTALLGIMLGMMVAMNQRETQPSITTPARAFLS